MENLQLGYPIKDFNFTDNVSQYFGVNRARYSEAFGLPAHNGLDCIKANDKLGYGTPLTALYDFDTCAFETDFPTKTRGSGIRMFKTLDKPFLYKRTEVHSIENLFWHIADFTIKAGTSGKKGDIVALIGNTGYVFPKPHNGCSFCPYLGSHVHVGLKFYDKWGKKIWNDYKGAIDPVPYMYQNGDKFKMRFDRDLYFGTRGNDVSNLQSLLKIELGDAVKYDPTGFYGALTVRSVAQLQLKHDIKPPLGFCGVLTRRYLRNTYLHQI